MHKTYFYIINNRATFLKKYNLLILLFISD